MSSTRVSRLSTSRGDVHLELNYDDEDFRIWHPDDADDIDFDGFDEIEDLVERYGFEIDEEEVWMDDDDNLNYPLYFRGIDDLSDISERQAYYASRMDKGVGWQD